MRYLHPVLRRWWFAVFLLVPVSGAYPDDGIGPNTGTVVEVTAKVVNAFPQRDVHLDTSQPLDIRISREKVLR